MESEKSLRSRYSNLLFTIFVVFIFLSLTFCPVPARAVQSDIGYIMIDGEKTIAMAWQKMGETNPAAGFPEVENLDTSIFTEANEHNFDFVMQYGPWRSVYDPWGPANDAEVLAYMDAAEANGIKVMIDIHNTNEVVTTHWVSVVKDHNALFGYYLEDEPAARYYISGHNSVSPAIILANYNALRAEDPDMNHPAYIAFGLDLSDWRVQNYFPACDMAGAELFATGWNDTYPTKFLQVPDDVNVAGDAGLDYLGMPRFWKHDDNLYSPLTAYLFRYMVFAPISMGADGFMPHIYEGWITAFPIEPEPGFRDTIVYPATDQLASVREILVRGDLVATSSNADGDLTWVFGGDSNEAVLIVVNNDPCNSKTSINFTLPGLDSSLGAAEVIGEGRVVMLDGSKTFTETNFAPYGVHIYHFKSFAFSVGASNETWMHKADPTYAFNSDGIPYNDLQVGNTNGNSDQIMASVVQLDLSAYAGKTAIGDGTLSFYAKLQPGHGEQYPPLDAFWVHELTKDYEVTEATWNEASTGDAWTDSTGTYWDLAGCGDRGAVVGDYRVPGTDTNWTLKTITVDQALLQSWLGDDTVSLHFGIKPDYYSSFFASMGTYLAGTGAGSPDGPVLTFEAVTAPACGDYDHPKPLSDLNGDCKVDFKDFALLAGTWTDDTTPE